MQSYGRQRKRNWIFPLYMIDLLKDRELFNRILIFNIIVILWKLKMESSGLHVCFILNISVERDIARHQQIFFQKCFKILNHTDIWFSFCFSSKSLPPRSLPVGLSVLAPISLDSLETVFYLVALQLSEQQNSKIKMERTHWFSII